MKRAINAIHTNPKRPRFWLGPFLAGLSFALGYAITQRIFLLNTYNNQSKDQIFAFKRFPGIPFSQFQQIDQGVDRFALPSKSLDPSTNSDDDSSALYVNQDNLRNSQFSSGTQIKNNDQPPSDVYESLNIDVFVQGSPLSGYSIPSSNEVRSPKLNNTIMQDDLVIQANDEKEAIAFPPPPHFRMNQILI